MQDGTNKVAVTTDNRKNNFDLLRLLAAFGVLLSHSFGILDKGLLQPTISYGTSRLIFSDIGLFIFFTISGYLVTQSLLNSKTIKHYLWKRFLRIWPGLVVVNIFCFLMGAAVTNFSLKDYLFQSSSWLYLVKNSSLFTMQYHIEGVFTSLHNTAVNASLWTILLEIKFYLLLIAIRFHSFFSNRILLVGGFIILCISRGIYFSMNDKSDTIDAYLLFGSYFYLGCLLHFFKKYHQFKLHYVILVWACFFIIPNQSIKEILLTLGIGYTILVIGNAKQIIDLKGNDISYGFYLYAFPIQQLVLLATGDDTNPWLHILYSSLITIPLALASWHIVERRFILRKSRSW